MKSNQYNNKLMEALEYLEYSNRYVKDYHVNENLLAQFYSIKNELMFILHKLFTHTGNLSYIKIPYVKRCSICKKKADFLYEIDSHKSWSYHLNMLPNCENDICIEEKNTIELILKLYSKRFSFHIPEKNTVEWDMSVDELIERQWIPEKDYESSLRLEDSPIKNVNLMISTLMEFLAYIRISIKNKNIWNSPTNGIRNIANKIHESSNRIIIMDEVEIAIQVAEIDTSLSIAKFRYIVEKLLRLAYQCEYNKSPKRKMLNELADDLKIQLTPPIFGYVKFVQKIGNSCVHPSINFVAPSLIDVEQTINYIYLINKWFSEKYQLNTKLA